MEILFALASIYFVFFLAAPFMAGGISEMAEYEIGFSEKQAIVFGILFPITVPAAVMFFLFFYVPVWVFLAAHGDK